MNVHQHNEILSADEILHRMRSNQRVTQRRFWLALFLLLVVTVAILFRKPLGIAFDRSQSDYMQAHLDRIEAELPADEQGKSATRTRFDLDDLSEEIRLIRSQATNRAVLDTCDAMHLLLYHHGKHQAEEPDEPMRARIIVRPDESVRNDLDWRRADAIVSMQPLVGKLETMLSEANEPNEQHTIGELKDAVDSLIEYLHAGGNGKLDVSVSAGP